MDGRRIDLLYAYEQLANQKELTHNLLLSVPSENIWTPPNIERNDVVSQTADIITRLFKYRDKTQKDLYPTGFVLADKDTCAAINEFNRRKTLFKRAIADYKGRNRDGYVSYHKHNEVHSLLSQAAKNRGKRSEFLESALKQTHLSELDLKSCYKQIRLIDENIKTISWLLENRHIRTHRVSRSQLMSMIDLLDEVNQIGPILEINKVPDEYFAIAKKTSVRFMANLTWYARRANQKNLVPTSSFLVSHCPEMPIISWLKNGERLERSGLFVDMNAAFIPILSAYRYVERKHDNVDCS